MKPQTHTVEVPPRIVAIVDRRTKELARRYLTMQDLPGLILSVYLQGLEDGFGVGERLAQKEMGFNPS